MNPTPSSSLASGLQRIAVTLFGIVLALSAFVLMIGALTVGLLAAAGWSLWMLLTGRKPTPMSFTWPRPPFGRTDREAAARRRGDDPGEVVDVQVREVPDEPR